MVLEQDIAVKGQTVRVLEKGPGIIDDLHRFPPCENRQPAHDGAGQEVRTVGFVNAIATARHGCLPGRGASGRAVPRGAWDRGTEGATEGPRERPRDRGAAASLWCPRSAWAPMSGRSASRPVSPHLLGLQKLRRSNVVVLHFHQRLPGAA